MPFMFSKGKIPEPVQLSPYHSSVILLLCAVIKGIGEKTKTKHPVSQIKMCQRQLLAIEKLKQYPTKLKCLCVK